MLRNGSIGPHDEEEGGLIREADLCAADKYNDFMYLCIIVCDAMKF